MRPFVWGTIWFVIGFIGWTTLSVILGITGGLGVESDNFGEFLLSFFFMIFFFSLPVAIITEIICWIKTKKMKNIKNSDLKQK